MERKVHQMFEAYIWQVPNMCVGFRTAAKVRKLIGFRI